MEVNGDEEMVSRFVHACEKRALMITYEGSGETCQDSDIICVG